MISKEKKYQTRDGREVRIYAVDSENEKLDKQVHGCFKNCSDRWEICSWFADGRKYMAHHHGLDLVEVDESFDKAPEYVWVKPVNLKLGHVKAAVEKPKCKAWIKYQKVKPEY